MTTRCNPCLVALLLLFSWAVVLSAQDAALPAAEPQPVAASKVQLPPAEPAAGVRRALILCGLPGDPPHRKEFADSLELLYTGLTRHHGFAAENVVLHWADEPTEMDGPAVKASRGVLNRESLAASVQTLAGQVQPDDALWVFVFGHTHYDGRYSWLNVAGPDLHQTDFAKLFSSVKCREQVFFITTSTSGFYQKALGQPGRIVITATEPDFEVNETFFAHKLARALGPTPPAYGDLDVDRDWRLSLLDVYLWTARETAKEFLPNMLLATEHSLLDDNGDGRGTELQASYLPEDLGGKLKAADKWPTPPTGDGKLTRTILLAWPPSPPVPPEAAAE
jgi:hypothetical protein